MGMPATIAPDWTVDMVDALPEDGQRYEIIDGELFVTPAPGEMHQDIVGELHARLRAYLKGHGVGKAMISPSDVRRGDRTRNRVQPDVFVVIAQRVLTPTNLACRGSCGVERDRRGDAFGGGFPVAVGWGLSAQSGVGADARAGGRPIVHRTAA